MFLFLKLLQPFLLPPTLIALGLFAALVFLYRKKERLAKMLLVIVFALYYVLSIEPTAFLLAQSLERQYPAAETISAQAAQAIVILAGGADKAEGNRQFPELGGASWRRLWRGIELYRQFDRKMPILYSGGSGDPFDPDSGEAELAKQYTVSMGIAEKDFLTENQSRTTAESGTAVRHVLEGRFPNLKQHTIVLVTSAKHMPRAVSVMRRQNMSVVPAPADFETRAKFRLNPLSFMPSAGHFASSVVSIHEWVGRGVYWLIAQARS